MKNTLLVALLLISFTGFSQNNDNSDKSELYEKYREDQFYFSITYNVINNKPNDVNQSGFSTGFHLGFIRDMPINENRNVAIGLGLGLSTNSYNQNVSIVESNNQAVFSIIDESDVNVSKNKFTTYLVEVPFEFRWRRSNATTYKFLRIYPGFKLGYVFYNSTKLNSDNGNVKLSNINDFSRLQYGLTLSVGYGTWNVHAYYGLNTIFDNSTLMNGESLDLKALKIGLMFYIL